MDGYNPATSSKIALEKRPEIDRYIISKLHTLIKKTREAFDALTIHVAADSIVVFLSDDLSQWWIRRSRRRFWEKKESEEKISAYNTLYEVIDALLRLIAPMVPYTAEYFYGEMVKSYFPDLPESIHLCDYPKANLVCIDEKLETEMKLVKEIIGAGRTVRAVKQLKNRLPLAEATIVSNVAVTESLNKYVDQLKEEMNVKKVIFKTSEADFQQLEMKPNLVKLGPKFKKHSSVLIRKLTSGLTPGEIQDVSEAFNAGTTYKIVIEDHEFELEPGDVNFVFKTVEDVATENFSSGQVYLNMKLTPDLLNEGLARDIVRRIQSMRKDAGLAFDDRIHLKIKTSAGGKSVIDSYRDFIKYETLADELAVVKTLKGESVAWEIKTADGMVIKLEIALEKV
ncbi:MAG: DUF5915 domain-containing protein [Candidatus Odinarchaeota archaeon]